MNSNHELLKMAPSCPSYFVIDYPKAAFQNHSSKRPQLKKERPPAKGEAGGKVSTSVKTHALGRRSVECSQYRLSKVLNIGETLKIVSDFVLHDWAFAGWDIWKEKLKLKRAIWADTFLV